jgi:hypothetical protein
MILVSCCVTPKGSIVFVAHEHGFRLNCHVSFLPALNSFSTPMIAAILALIYNVRRAHHGREKERVRLHP